MYEKRFLEKPVMLLRQLEEMQKLTVLRTFTINVLRKAKEILPQLTLDENDETMYGFGYKIAIFFEDFNVNVVNMFPSKNTPRSAEGRLGLMYTCMRKGF